MRTSRADLRTVSDSEGTTTGELSNKERGEVIRNRRLAAKIKSANKLAELSGVHRDSVNKAERGDPSVMLDTYDRLSKFLDEYAGEPASQVEQLEFVVEGERVKVTLKGPVTDREALKRDVADIIRAIRESSPPEA